MKHEHILGPAERSLLCDLITVLQRIKRETPSQLWLNEQFLSLNHKVDQAMTQQHTDALALMSKLDSDVKALIAAIQTASNPPTPEDWSDVLSAAQAIDSNVTGATPTAPPAA